MLDLKFKGVTHRKRIRVIVEFNIDITKVLSAEIRLTSSGYGVEHELVELDIMTTVLKVYPEIINFDYDYCRSIFHYYTNESLGMKPHVIS
jgi:hypothetical protein